ncbi:MAG: hypothetical protein Q4B54_06245 [Coriobacteriales bacterium]|nr:hypothetical protein [Coriobacteriales bacterium]
MLAVKVVLGILVVVAVLAFAVSFLKSSMGKPFAGTLNVPKGKQSVGVDLFDDGPLKPIRYSLALDVNISAQEATLTSSFTGEQRTDTGVVSRGNKPIGFVDISTSYARALMALAQKYPKLVVQAAVMGTDANDRPRLELLLPEAKWFKKALEDAARDRD